MKEILKSILSWILGFFNVGVFVDDGNLDSLLVELYSMEMELNQAHSLLQLQQLILWVEVTKCALMLLSILFLYLANETAIKDAASWAWNKAKKAYQFLSQKFKKLFKTKPN